MKGKRRGRRGCGSRGKRVGEEAERICSIFPSVKERSTFKLIQLPIFAGNNQRPLRTIFVDLNAINVAVIRPRLGKYWFGVLLL
jgi:hypothetical protein